jgi:hypothetical protein
MCVFLPVVRLRKWKRSQRVDVRSECEKQDTVKTFWLRNLLDDWSQVDSSYSFNDADSTEDLGRKDLELVVGSVWEFARRDWGTPRRISGDMSGNPAEVWMRYLQNSGEGRGIVILQDVLGRTNRLLAFIRHGPHWIQRVQQFFCCCVCICYRGNVSTEPLPSDDRGTFA